VLEEIVSEFEPWMSDPCHRVFRGVNHADSNPVEDGRSLCMIPQDHEQFARRKLTISPWLTALIDRLQFRPSRGAVFSVSASNGSGTNYFDSYYLCIL
jgi:hypothetical protein